MTAIIYFVIGNFEVIEIQSIEEVKWTHLLKITNDKGEEIQITEAIVKVELIF